MSMSADSAGDAANLIDPPVHPLLEVAWLFLLLGTVAFGGPGAHVALMRREVVGRSGWGGGGGLGRMFAACNLIPGPSSTELAMFLGYRRAGWPAMLLAG